MKKNEFVQQLSEYCEFEGNGFKLDTSFRSIDGFDSMALMAMIAFADEKFKIKLTSQQLVKLTDFKSFMDIIGENKFEND
jgi:acyl carrier protein